VPITSTPTASSRYPREDVKSRGTGISRCDISRSDESEWLRYYISAKLNSNVEDLDFNPDDFVARVNSD